MANKINQEPGASGLLPTDSVLVWEVTQTPHTRHATIGQVLGAMATLPASFSSIKIGGVSLVPGPSTSQFNALNTSATANNTSLTSIQSRITALQSRVSALDGSGTTGNIVLATIPDQIVGAPFTVSGTITGLSVLPTFEYQDNAGTWLPFPVTASGPNQGNALFFEDFNTKNISWTAWNPTSGMATPGNGSVSLAGHAWTITAGGVPQVDGVNAGTASQALGLWNVGGTIWIDCITDRWFSWSGTTWNSGSAPIGRAWLDHYPFGGNEYFLPFVDEREYMCSSQAGYTSSTAFSPFSVANSVLTIKAQSVASSGFSNPAGQTWNGGNISSCTEVNATPTSGLFSFTTGYVEIYCQIPAGGPTNLNGPGFWPQCVLYPLAGTHEEIDIFEILGGSPTVIRQTIHIGDSSTALSISPTAAINTGFHRVGVDKQTDFITFYVDNVVTGSIPTPSGGAANTNFARPFYINIGLAVAGSASWGGGTPLNTLLVDPGVFQIDYVGVWSSYAAAWPMGVSGPETISVNTISSPLSAGTAFQVSGIIQNASGILTLEYQDTVDGTPGAWTAFPVGSTIAQSSYSFIHPGFVSAATSVTVSVRDANAVTITGISNTFSVVAISGTRLDPANKGADITLSNGNLTAAKAITGANDWENAKATVAVSSGKYYFECSTNVLPFGGFAGFGLSNASLGVNVFGGGTTNGIQWGNDGQIFYNNAQLTVISGSNANDVIGIAFDVTNGLLWVQNITQSSFWNNSGAANPVTGAGGITIGVTGSLFVTAMIYTGFTETVNFGPSYVGSVPSGFSSVS